MNYPTFEDVKEGMKVLVELKNDRGTGKLTEGIVEEKISTDDSDPSGIVVDIGNFQIGRVHKIIDSDFIDKNNPNTHISLHAGENFNNRIKVIDLLSRAKNFIWILNGYFRHNHFDILNEVLKNNKNVSEIKILSIILPTKEDTVRLKTYAGLFKEQFKNISIELKLITDIEVGRTFHNRFYFTQNQAWDFIELDTLLRNQRDNIDLQPDADFENNMNDFKQYWDHQDTLSIFDDGYGKIMNYYLKKK